MDVARALRAARGGAQRVGGNVIRVDGGAGGAVGDGNGAGAQVEIVGEGNGDARAARERAGEAALIHVAEFILSVEEPSPVSAFQTGPSCRQESVGMKVRL